MNQTNTPAGPRVPLPEFLHSISNRSDRVSALVADLESRLSPVLRADKPQGEGVTKHVCFAECELAAHAESLAHRLELIGDRVANILDRIDL